jgi:tetratricopeptide (TPR) repeat protein
MFIVAVDGTFAVKVMYPMVKQAGRWAFPVRWRHALPVVAILLVAACDSPEERVEKHYTRGMALLEEGAVSKARLEFRNALRIDSDHVDSRYQMGVLAEEAGNFQGAASQYARIAELDESRADVRVKLTQFNLAAGNIDSAKTYAEEALALDPENAETLAAYGAILYRLGDHDGALANARRALEIDPDAITAHVVLLSDMVRREQPDAAMAALDDLLQRLPEDQTLNQFKLQLVANAGDIEALEAQLLRMAALFPDQTQYRVTLARLYLSQDRPSDAKAQMRAMLEDSPNDADRALALIQLIAQTDGIDAAQQELETMMAAAGSPGSGFVRRLTVALADLHISQNRPAEAIALLESRIPEIENVHDADPLRIKIAEIEVSQGNNARAKELSDAVLERDPEHTGALAVRAILQIDDYQPEDAILTLRRALSNEPQNARLLLLEARAHERNGNPTLALERLAGATRASDFDPAIAMQYANALQTRDQIPSAETVIEEASRRHPQNRDLLARLAALRLALDDPAGANAVAEQLSALDNGDGQAQQIAAATLLREGRLDEGASLLEAMVDEAGSNGNVLANLIVTYLRQNETDRAVALLDDLIAQNPANLQAQVLRAELHLRDGDAAAAEAVLRNSVAAAPESNVGYLTLARLKLQQGDPAAAQEAVQAGLEAIPDDQPLTLLLAQLHELNGDFDEALEVYGALYEQNPDSVLLANNYSSLLAEFREDDPEAVALAQRIARRLRGSSVPHFQDTYGWIAFLNGRTEEALEVLTEAAAALPDNALVRYHLGRTEAAMGNTAAARSELEASLAIDPNFPKAASARAALATLEAGGG